MANHKSAAKRARQAPRREAKNTQRKSRVRTVEKKFVKALTEKNLSEAGNLLKSYMTEVMRAAKTKVVSKNLAARKISRLSARLNALTK